MYILQPEGVLELEVVFHALLSIDGSLTRTVCYAKCLSPLRLIAS